jgi:hypothetical protein
MNEEQSNLYPVTGFLNVGKNYHAMMRDVDRLLIMASDYVTYRLSWELGLKPKDKLTVAPIRKLQSQINKLRLSYNLKCILVVEDLRTVNRSIKQRQSVIRKCELCGGEVMKIDTHPHYDVKGKRFYACYGCSIDWELQHDDRCRFCEELFHPKALSDFDGDKVCAGCLEELK